MLYLGTWIGAGTRADPFRPRGTDGVPGWSAVDLRLDQTSATGFCLLGTDAVLSVSDADLLALDKLEALSAVRRNRIENRLGVTLTGATMSAILEELLFIDLGKWKPCRVSLVNKRKEVWAGGVLWASKLFPAADPQSMDPTDDFNRANETPLAGNWSKSTGSSSANINLTSNAIVASAAGDKFYYWNAASFNNDQYSQTRYPTFSSSSFDGGPACRILTTGLQGYWTSPRDASLSEQAIHKLVAASYSTVATALTTFANGDTLRMECSGSSVLGKKNGTTIVSATDTSIASGPAGVFIYEGVTLDDWQAENLTAVGSLIHNPRQHFQPLIVR